MEKKIKEEEKYCGNCCWFYAEDTDGWGFCACQKGKDLDTEHCSDMCEDDFVSRQEMRHHMAVLLQHKRFLNDKSELTMYRPVRIEDLHKAEEFAYRYMKVFSEL
jgi:hypothetical protein